MGLLRDFERRLEGAVEGLFARAFRSGVQPVELGKRLVRAVEDSRQVGVSRVYVDNLYSIELSPRDRQRFADYERALTSELAARVVSRVEASEQPVPAARGWAQEPVGPVGPATAMLPGEVRHSRPHAPASLTLLMATGAVSQVYPLNRSEVLIGRSEQSDIALADPGVSRNHARIIREGDDFIVEDLRSTNGTEVNGQPIRRRRLADGDVVKLANSTLQFRREG